MSPILRHVSARLYVLHSETSKQPSVDLVHISECKIQGGLNGIANELNPEVLTIVLKQRSKKEKGSVSQPLRFILIIALA